MSALRDKHVLLGVSGGIAAYKAPLIVRELMKAGAAVRVVLTRSAQQFVAPLALQVVSEAPVGVTLFDPQYESEIGHIDLARWADIVLLSPATAHLIGRMATGQADDLLTTVLLATRAPIVVAPSMNTKMLEHPAVQANLGRLRDEWGATVVAPDQGELACREVGAGRLPDPDVLIDALTRVLTPSPLAGRRVLVTAGPTREWVDPVRFLSNPSSGRMGFAMARAARHLGADVVLLSGPTEVSAPVGVRVQRVETAAEMAQFAQQLVAAGIDIAVFAAAVADFRPARRLREKAAKTELSTQLELERTPDVLATIVAANPRPFCVGFAAETRDLEARAVQKCRRKGCDLIVGNDVSDGGGFGRADNQVVVADADAVRARLGPAAKQDLAAQIWSHIVDVYARTTA